MIRAASGITLERLLGHAAGIRPLTEDDEFIGLPAERSAVARLLVSEPPLFGLAQTTFVERARPEARREVLGSLRRRLAHGLVVGVRSTR